MSQPPAHTPWPACPARFNLAAHVIGKAHENPDKIALAVLSPSGSERWSFARLSDAVLGTAGGLLSLGLRRGDRILMRLGNTVDFPVAFLGAIAAGMIPVPTSAMLTEPEVSTIVRELHPAAILHDPAVAGTGHERVVDLQELRSLRSCRQTVFHDSHRDDPAYVIYTSGTSGKPRGVVHAHRAIWARGMMHDGWYGLRPDDRMMHAGAFNWTYTLGTGLMDPWSLGATALIPAQGVPHDMLPLLMKRHDATIFAAAPGVYRRILALTPRLDLPRLRHGLSAGEKLPPATLARWQEATGTTIYEAFGMSECSTFISSAPAHPAAPETLGRPQPGRRVAIVGPDGPVPAGTPGTIAVHRSDPGLMLGYLDAPEDTAARFRGDWFLTDDQGVMDADGQIAYLGRDDDMMNAGGYRVSPIEVETALATLPGITGIAAAEVAVKADTRVIAAFYTSAEPLDAQDLSKAAEARLAGYKRPRIWVRVDHLPVNANGKLLRRRLREGYETDHDQA